MKTAIWILCLPARLFNWVIKKIELTFFVIECPRCGARDVHQIGEDWTGQTWFNVYECNTCKKWFV